MQIEELRYVCQEAAIDLAGKGDRPVPPTLVLPGPDRTRLLKLSDFPDDDEQRHAYVARLASDEVVPGAAPCWGFVAEAEAAEGDDVVVVVYGARRHAPELTASRIDERGHLDEFVPAEELDPTAMPFLHPLQHAVDSLPAMDAESSTGPHSGGLPFFGQGSAPEEES